MSDAVAPTIGQLSRPGFPADEWDRGPWNRWSFQHVCELVPTVLVHRGRLPTAPLPERPQPLDQIAFDHLGQTLTIGSFLDRAYTDGFIVLHQGAIVFERYMNGMTDRTRHLSQSVAKSITGTVAGILSARGQFDTQAFVTDYLPELDATAYREARIQHVLDMASGVAFSEAYTDPNSDVAMLDFADGWKRTGKPGWPQTTWELILGLTKLERPHGQRFNYRSIETDVLAFAMERATGQRLADLVSSLIWDPMGAEQDAYFTVDPAGYALADGGFNATLRDYARFGLLHAADGVAQGRQVVPREWIAAIREILATVRALCDVRSVDVETHDLAERWGFAIYDCLIVAAALRAGCKTIYSEDLQRGQRIESLTIRNPFVGP